MAEESDVSVEIKLPYYLRNSEWYEDYRMMSFSLSLSLAAVVLRSL